METVIFWCNMKKRGIQLKLMAKGEGNEEINQNYVWEEQGGGFEDDRDFIQRAGICGGLGGTFVAEIELENCDV